MVGFELLGSPQRDFTPEDAAARLRAVSAVHYTERAATEALDEAPRISRAGGAAAGAGADGSRSAAYADAAIGIEGADPSASS